MQEQVRLLQVQPTQQHLSVQKLTARGEELKKAMTEHRSRHVLPLEDRPTVVGTMHCALHKSSAAPCRRGVLGMAGERNLRRTSCAAKLTPGDCEGMESLLYLKTLLSNGDALKPGNAFFPVSE